MHTKHVNIVLPDYVRGILDAEDTKHVEEHLKHCQACQANLADVKQVFGAVENTAPGHVEKAYFNSLLPRIHERLEKGRRFAWSGSPVLNKLALPLGAAVVVAVLLWHVPFLQNSGATTDPLLAVVDSASADDIAEIVLDDIPSHDLSSFNAMVISHALTDDQLVSTHLVEEALASETTSPFNVFADVTPVQALSGFSEAETNALLQQLGKMESL